MPRAARSARAWRVYFSRAPACLRCAAASARCAIRAAYIHHDVALQIFSMPRTSMRRCHVGHFRWYARYVARPRFSMIIFSLMLPRCPLPLRHALLRHCCYYAFLRVMLICRHADSVLRLAMPPPFSRAVWPARKGFADFADYAIDAAGSAARGVMRISVGGSGADDAQQRVGATSRRVLMAAASAAFERARRQYAMILPCRARACGAALRVDATYAWFFCLSPRSTDRLRLPPLPTISLRLFAAATPCHAAAIWRHARCFSPLV